MPLLIQPFIIKGMDLLYCSLPLLKTYTFYKWNVCQTYAVKRVSVRKDIILLIHAQSRISSSTISPSDYPSPNYIMIVQELHPLWVGGREPVNLTVWGGGGISTKFIVTMSKHILYIRTCQNTVSSVIHFVSASAKFGICTVAGLNGTLAEAKKRKTHIQVSQERILASTSVPFRPTTVKMFQI